MRACMQRTGLLLAIAGLVIWLVGGARKGFYVVTEELPKLDPITEIAYSVTQSKFLPGIEVLVLGLILGGSFFLISFLSSKR